MQNTIPSQLSDSELVAAVATLAGTERRTTVALIAHLAELEARQLYLGAGYPSMFVYCVQVLRLSGGGAYNRIEAARVARRFPIVLELLEQGLLNLATLRLLAPHLTTKNHEELLAAASGRSKREVQALVARAFPRPDVAPSIRKLPDRTPPQNSVGPPPSTESVAALCGSGGEDGTISGNPPRSGEPPIRPGSAVPPFVSLDAIGPAVFRAAAYPLPRHPLVTALSADRYQIRFTASGSLREKLRLAQDLLRHAVPDGDPAEIFDRALTSLLDELDRKKFAATDRPRASRGPASGARTIPAAVKRFVTTRDHRRCAFVARSGTRCGTRAFLEFHHVVPYARGGPATVENIQLRCRAHNGYEADIDFGRAQGFETVSGVSAALSTRPGTSWPNGTGQRSMKEEESR